MPLMVFSVPQILDTNSYLKYFPEALNYGYDRHEHGGRLGQPKTILSEIGTSLTAD